MWDCVYSTCLHETNKNSTTITSIKKASQERCFFYYKNSNEPTHSSSKAMRLASQGCYRPSYYRLVLFKILIVIIVRFHVLAPIRSGTLQVCPHDYKYEHQSSHVALELG